MNRDELKRHLREIVNQKYAQPASQESQSALVQGMLTHIGDPDPILRDELIYMTLATWISRGYFRPEQLESILNELLDKHHLFYALGNSGNDTLFTRSFSVLMLQPIVAQHLKTPFLTDAEILNMLDNLLRYLAGERDLRGYVTDKGWGHAVAHTADVLDELVQCEVLHKAELVKVLDVIRDVMGVSDIVFQYEEDERMVTAVIHTWKRSLLSHDEIHAWLQGFVASQSRWTSMPPSYRSYLNRKQFLRSLYFAAQHKRLDESVVGAVVETLEKLK